MTLPAEFDLSTAQMIAVLTGLVIPHLSALATKAPTWLTGFLTTLLAAVSGTASTYAASGPFNWKTAVGTTAVTWAVALFTQKGWLSGTTVETALHAFPRAFVVEHKTETLPNPSVGA